jgi:septal ring factor EnvC (AmiA/AmiB activator)
MTPSAGFKTRGPISTSRKPIWKRNSAGSKPAAHFEFTEKEIVMKRTVSVIGKLGISLCLVLVAGIFLETHAQALQECKAKLEAANSSLETANQLLDVKDQKIANLNEQVANRVAKAEALQEKINALNDVIAELRKQVDLSQENNATLKDSLHLQQSVMDSRQQAITDRDLLIKELVKANKRSALEKIVESLPSLAGIIAIALTAGK